MKPLLATALALLAAGGVAAQTPAQPQDRRPPEPRVQRTVIDDDNVHIEELRVRGLNTSLVVTPKHGVQYEVVPAPGGRDPSLGRLGSQGAAGQRVWNILKF